MIIWWFWWLMVVSNCETNYENGLEDGWGDGAAIVVQQWWWRCIGREGVEWWERERGGKMIKEKEMKKVKKIKLKAKVGKCI